MADANPAAPIDLIHLQAQTGGDVHLERQVLEMFRQQMPHNVEVLRAAEPGRPTRDAAHRIVGAARAIGAIGVAEAARDIEHAERTESQSIDKLVSEFALADSFIADYLAA